MDELSRKKFFRSKKMQSNPNLSEQLETVSKTQSFHKIPFNKQSILMTKPENILWKTQTLTLKSFPSYRKDFQNNPLETPEFWKSSIEKLWKPIQNLLWSSNPLQNTFRKTSPQKFQNIHWLWKASPVIERRLK